MAYHEVAGSRRYQVRYIDVHSGSFSSWLDAGDATPENLAKIRAAFPDTEYEVQQFCEVADDTGSVVGWLTFSTLADRRYKLFC